MVIGHGGSAWLGHSSHLPLWLRDQKRPADWPHLCANRDQRLCAGGAPKHQCSRRRLVARWRGLLQRPQRMGCGQLGRAAFAAESEARLMLERIVAALQARADIQGWSARLIRSRGVQLYAVPDAVEARRATASERYVIQVLRHTGGLDAAKCGGGNATLLPGDDIDAAINAAALMAGLVQNQPYDLPAPGALPDLPLADPKIQANAAATLDDLLAQLRAAAAAHPQVLL